MISTSTHGGRARVLVSRVLGRIILLVLALKPRAALGQSLSFAEAMRLARGRAPVVLTARARTGVADARIEGSRVGLFPKVTGSVGGGFFTSNGAYFFDGAVTPASVQEVLYGQAGVSVEWTVLDFGRTSQGIRAAERGRTAAGLDLRTAEQEAIRTAALTYVELVADQRLLDAFREMLTQRERMLATTQAMVRSGVRSPIEAVRAEVAAQSAREELAIAVAKRDSDGEELAAFLGLAPGQAVEVDAVVDLPKARPEPSSRPAPNIDGRPDILAAEQRVLDASHTTVASRRAYVPVLSATGAATGYYSSDRETSLGSLSATGTVGLTISVPVFDPAIGASVRMADAQLALAEASRGALTTTLRHEAVRAAGAVRNSELVLAEATALATGAAASLADVEARYRAGFLSPLELLDAQRTDRDARLRQIRAELQIKRARVDLMFALGTIDTLGSSISP
jgi:multidrug efflux system outer membrane protein